MYKINAQLANVCGVNDVPFGGLNMVFSGDFAQLPPAVGREHVSLYSKSIGAVASDRKSQEEAIGKALSPVAPYHYRCYSATEHETKKAKPGGY